MTIGVIGSVVSTLSQPHIADPGHLQKTLESSAQRRLVQSFLDQKAVEGHTSFLLDFTRQEEFALANLVEKGWVQEVKDRGWQLTKLPLQNVQVNMLLHYPFNVFKGRAATAIDQCTTYELILTLQQGGWHELPAKNVKKKKSQAPFEVGV